MLTILITVFLVIVVAAMAIIPVWRKDLDEANPSQEIEYDEEADTEAERTRRYGPLK